jgi:hypothetical protein
MAEITAPAYQNIRDYIQANWKWIALMDNQGVPVQVVRLQQGVDSRVTWTHVAGAQTLELTVVVKGSDADIGGVNGANLPKTLASSQIHASAGSATSFSTESFAPFTIQTVDDELTIKHRIQVPKVGP